MKITDGTFTAVIADDAKIYKGWHKVEEIKLEAIDENAEFYFEKEPEPEPSPAPKIVKKTSKKKVKK
jgi:hypothetical protein